MRHGDLEERCFAKGQYFTIVFINSTFKVIVTKRSIVDQTLGRVSQVLTSAFCSAEYLTIELIFIKTRFRAEDITFSVSKPVFAAKSKGFS